MRIRSLFGLAGTVVLVIGGCYEGEFLTGLPCDEDADCARRSFCDAQLCGGRISPRGPGVALGRPTDVPDGSEDAVTLVASYDGMNLADPDEPPERWPFAHGYIDVVLDGETFHRFVAGDGTAGEVAAVVDLGDRGQPGLHRLQATARDLEGALWDADESSDDAVFWVVDGTPRVDVVRPADGSRAPRNRDLTVVASVADFRLVPPPGEMPGGVVPTDAGQVAVFLHLDFPQCLPDCTVDDALVRIGQGFGGGGSSRELAFTVGPGTLSPTPFERETVTMVFALVTDDGAFVSDGTGDVVHRRIELTWD